jgi:hypothetical protein
MALFTAALLALTVSAIAIKAESLAPIRLDARNPHYFLYKGKTVALISSGEHYGAVINADVDYTRYLATLSSLGLNYTRLFGGSYIEVPAKSFGIQRNDLAPKPGRFVAPWSRSSQPGYAGGGNKFDLRDWEPRYFDRLQAFITQAEKSGIVVELTLFSSQYDETQWRISPFNASNNVNGTDLEDWRKLNTLENGRLLDYQERYVRKLVREANMYSNVIFEIQNEPWSDRPVLNDVVNPYLPADSRDKYPNSVDLADNSSITWQTRVAQWITSEESALPNRHLIAQNYCNFRFPVRELIPGVSVVNFHYAYSDAVLLNYGLSKAISYDETGFLGRSDSAYLRQAWNFMLSGGSVFNALDYSFTPGHEDGNDTAPNGPGGGSPEFRRELGILGKFLGVLPLVDMKPEEDVSLRAAGAYAHALSSAKGEYAIYLDGDGPSELTLHLPAGRYRAEWLDVHTGSSAGGEDFEHGGGERKMNTPKYKGGLALHLVRDARVTK